MKQYALVFCTDMGAEDNVNRLAEDGYRIVCTGNDQGSLVLVMERDRPEPLRDPKRSTAEIPIDHFFQPPNRLAEVEVMAGQVDDETELRRDLQDLLNMGAIVENPDGSFSLGTGR